jgi:hypothetical protein
MFKYSILLYIKFDSIVIYYILHQKRNTDTKQR